MSDPDSLQKTSRKLWVTAAAVAVALHLGGGALALAHLQTNEPEEDLGAPAIEVGLELGSPKQDPSDLPPGPDSDASVATPAMPEQKAEVKETDLPKAIPTETEDPDRVVTPNDVKKPIEDDAKVATVQTQASQESAAAEATATPTVEDAPQAEKSVAPAQGIGASLQRVKVKWEKELVAHFDRHKRYPADRALKGAEVVVSIVLDRVGHVLSASIAKGSGDRAFDDAALAMVHRSDPVPQPPPAVADEGLSFTLPVNFRTKGKG
ncbi:TonB family protein [Bradyrhizobium sp. Tv2a-2]|uniref:TonB family protein n=1 Tax=Bradyrhizobium sp. Tv2a-2 TaxID=113395 RepID=UPI0003FA4F2D|nr:TonB family protein [Bradyrhizobium sp. Tv2a-2]